MKFTCRFDKDYIALFSNINSISENAFYLLMTYHKSRKSGFDHGITVEKCNKLLKRKNRAYYYQELNI